MTSIYNPKTRFLVVDIETTKPKAKGEKGFIFDISFGVFSRKDGVLGKIGYIVKENESKTPWYEDRLTKYRNYLASGKYQVKGFAEIVAIMKKIIDKYQVEYVTAYNLKFDKDDYIERVCKELGIESPFKNLKAFDIWQGAAETLGQRKSYKNFTDTNGFVHPTGNRMSGAEIMYRYMTNQPDFVEEHTGLADIEIEMELLDRILRQKKKMSKTYGKGAWRLVQG